MSAALPIVIRAPRIPGGAEEYFYCEHHRCSLRGAACLDRQKPREKQSRYGLKYDLLGPKAHCQSGKCDQGREVAVAVAGLDKACGECGAIHDATQRRELIRRALARGAEPAAVREEWSHVWPDDPGTPGESRKFWRDLSAVRNEQAPLKAAPKEGTMPPRSALTDMTDDQVRAALEKHGSVQRTAKELGCSWATLDSRLKKMKPSSAPEQRPVAAAPSVDVEAVLRARVTELRAELGVLSEKQKELTKLERALEALEAE